ncbi:hypothetical protein BGZ63DRAFT_27936 [Mariannaea sp. PMI_226]|nr:hypothetical protein BGZ63DRAFT_27936 [Mariannaea sp. PMI_226]
MSQELETPCGSCQGYWSIRYEKVDVDVDIDDTEPSHGCLAGDGPEAARPPFLPPIREVPKPRRRAIWVWICVVSVLSWRHEGHNRPVPLLWDFPLPKLSHPPGQRVQNFIGSSFSEIPKVYGLLANKRKMGLMGCGVGCILIPNSGTKEFSGVRRGQVESKKILWLGRTFFFFFFFFLSFSFATFPVKSAEHPSDM